jgi:hypothetical protein
MDSMSIPHNNQFRRLMIAFILLAVVLVAALQPMPGAAQDEDGYAYYWSLDFDFNSSANGILYVEVGYNDNGAPLQPPIHAERTRVFCNRTGNASVSGGFLHLNGGYLSCEIDIEQALNNAFAACEAKVSGCSMQIEEEEYYAHFRADATVLSNNTGVAPIFYHEDASFTINPQTSMTQITAALAPHGLIPSTPQIGLLGVSHMYSAFYSCGGACTMAYGVDGALEVVPTAHAMVPFSTPATTIYIGYDPVSGITAPVGTHIDSLFVDPPNHGND